MDDVELLNQFTKINDKIDDKTESLHTKIDNKFGGLPCMDHQGRISGLEQSRINGKEFAVSKHNGRTVLLAALVVVVSVLVCAAAWATFFK